MGETKTCTQCGEAKPLGEFYKSPTGRLGVGSYCKSCSKKSAKKWRTENRERNLANKKRWRQNNPEKHRDHNRRYHKNLSPEKKREKRRKYYESLSPEKKREKRRKYYESLSPEKRRKYYESLSPEKKREKRREYNQRWCEKNPEKRIAHLKIRVALLEGSLIKPNTCSQCGARGRIEGHHEDYNKPLDVEWLCTKCHGQRHRIKEKE